MITRSYRWPRYTRRINIRVPYYVDPVTMTIRAAYGSGGAGLEPRRRAPGRRDVQARRLAHRAQACNPGR